MIDEIIQREIDHYLSKKTIYYNNFSLELISYLNINYPNQPLQAQWFMLTHKIKSPNTCKFPGCTNLVKWNKRKAVFDEGCCKLHNQKITFKKNFGVDHPLKNDNQKQKLKSTVKQKYGVDSVAKLESVKEKRHTTNLEKYGVPEAASSKVVRDKIEKTVKSKYGVNTVFENIEIQTKAKETIKNRYGVDEILSKKEIRTKINDTNFERYGSIFPMRNVILQEKRRNTIIDKYDAYGANAHPTVSTKFKKTIYTNYYTNKLISNPMVTPLFSIDEYCGTLDAAKRGINYKWQCKNCNTIFYDYLAAGHLPSCTTCFPRIWNRSKGEILLFGALDVKNKIANDRTIIGREIDIMLPDFSIGIEFNGMYWHSEQKGKDKYYHFNKTIDAENNGVRLIQIYENEWINKPNVVLGHINRLLGKSQLLVSDDLTISIINNIIFDQFINENSFMDHDHFGRYNYGLYYGGDLVAVMNFSNNGDDATCELRKFVIKIGYDISGNILEKVIDANLPNKTIYYYQDRRYYSYIDVDKIIQNGFEFQGVTEPTFYYFKNTDFFILTPNILKNLHNYLKHYNSTLSVNENLEINGFLKIWDCGKLMFKK